MALRLLAVDRGTGPVPALDAYQPPGAMTPVAMRACSTLSATAAAANPMGAVTVTAEP
jgi:hypothetical protein